MPFHWIGKSADGQRVVLNRLDLNLFQFPEYFHPDWEKANPDLVRYGVVLDVETTGLISGKDQVIEIGLRQFKFNRETGELLSLEKHYSAFQDPGIPLDPEITRITGITDEMVKGEKIDWSMVDRILTESQIVIAHNASFDRPFVDPNSPASREKIWACSVRQIRWKEYGYPSKKLEVLSIYHGFFNDAHRALQDSDSLLFLLSQINPVSGKPHLHELIHEARKPVVEIFANGAPFENKDLLKSRGYRWNANARVWSCEIPKEELQDEIQWLEQAVYVGAFRGKAVEIPPIQRFKA